MRSALRPGRMAIILGTVCALGAGTPTVALATGESAVLRTEGTGASGTTEAVALTEFESKSNGTVTCENGVTTVSRVDGDHFAMLKDGKSYESLDYQADVKVTDGISAALVVGAANATEPGSNTWYGFNFNNGSADQRVRLFRVNDSMNVVTFSQDQVDSANLDTTDTVHLRVQIDETGFCRVTASDAEGHEVSGSATIQDWQGGYVGLLTFNSMATFSNVTISEDAGLSQSPEESSFATNLQGNYKAYGSGTTEVTDGGLKVASTSGDYMVRWEGDEASFGDMVYSADVNFESATVDGAASLVLHSDDADLTGMQSYVANVNPKTGECRLFKFERTANEGRIAYNMLPSIQLGESVSNSFHLSVTTIGKHMIFSVSYQDAAGKTVTKTASTADYTLGTEDNDEEVYAHYGQNTALRKGYCGLLSFNAAVTYRNVTVTPLTEGNSPKLTSLQITGDEVDMPFSFQETAYVYVGYVKGSAQSVGITYETENPDAKVTVTDESGVVYEPQNGSVTVPVADRGTDARNEGLNQYTVTVEDPDTGAVAVYQLRIFCEGDEDSYYYEDQRGQFHYSVKNGWGNDPCGLVKTSDGVYHFYYQAYTDTDWGPMHWGYATSTDLVHWEEQPIALYPDEYGAQFSGCGVYANHFTAPNIFDQGEEGMVFIVTANGREGQDGKQRLTLAYATYNPDTKTMGAYQKYDDVLLDYNTDDIITPADGAFRDPKVFRFDDKWFLIVAGGPVRFYSSGDLVNWKGESYLDEPAGGHVYTECPDLYPVKAEDGTIKWILSRGGTSYKVGEFKNVVSTNVAGGQYAFVQDEGTPDYTMNFGRDAYAAMTYFNAGSDFGTSGSVNCPELVAMNWMNTWDYNKLVQNTGNWRFNGTYNLPVKLGLTQDSHSAYRLTQEPVDKLDDLRDESGKVEVSDMAIDGVAPLDFNGTSYEIEATFMPEEGAQPTVGFDVRVGAGQKTRVSYDFATDTVTLDRSQSGFILNDAFGQVRSQTDVDHNQDGSVTLHIYVDRMSVEVFTGDYVAAGANQIFPSPISDGLEAFSENGGATLDATVWSMESIWEGQRSESPSTEAASVSLSQYALSTYVGQTSEVAAWVSPSTASQDLTFTVDDPSVVSVEPGDNSVRVTGRAAGTTTVRVASATSPNLTKDLTVTVREDNFQTNVSGLEHPAGAFYADGETLGVSSVQANSFLVSSEKYPVDGLTYDVDVNHVDGMENLVFGMQTANAFDGCYAVQLNGSGSVRLFDFKGDKTLATAENAVTAASDGTYHVGISVSGRTITVTVNDEEALTYELKDTDPLYDEGYVGIGVWDADETTFENFYVGGTANASARSELEAAVKETGEKVAALVEGDYTSESWEALERSIADAKALLDSNDKNVTSADMRAAAQAMSDALEALEKNDEDNPGGGAVNPPVAPGGADDPGASEEPETPAIEEVYEDIDVDAWYYDSVDWVVDRGYMSGYGDGTNFGPADDLSRAQMVTVLYRLAGEPDADPEDVTRFPDCDPNAFYAKALAWAFSEGVFTGMEDGSFAPSDGLTREQAATALFRLAEAVGADTSARTDLSDYPDAESVSPFASDAMSWAVATGVLSGRNPEPGVFVLDPGDVCSRAELAALLQRLLGE